jgi:hypothetical protein
VTDRDKEMIKLSANYLNGLAIVFAGVGGLSGGLNLLNNPDGGWFAASLFGGLSLLLSLVIHRFALLRLKQLP